MTDEPQDTGADEPEQPETDEPEQDEPEEWQPPSREDYEKLQRTAEARKRERDKYAKEARRLREANADPADAPDPLAEVNARIVGERARTELAKIGVTDDDDQDAVLDRLNLAGVEVDERGRPDRDAIADMVDTLRRIFRESAPPNGRARTPRLDTRDRAGAGGQQRSRDEERWARIAGRR
jgi:hypothetical protein